MDKKKLVDFIRIQLEKDLKALKAAAMETYAAATGEESQPENEYDTRALEASYLAGAQAKRVGELEAMLTGYKYLELVDFKKGKPIGATAFVELELKDKKLFIFLVPMSGSVTVDFDNKQIQVITMKSPLGEALLGLKEGDTAVVERGDEALEYEILSVS